jgi:prepilin-type processing-associated H-X9-DG protein
MRPLNNEQKQILFDYAVGLTSEQESAEAKALITSNEEAAKIYSRLKVALTPLESIECEPCPDELVEGTIWKVNSLASPGYLGLEHLLADAQKQTVTAKVSFWRNLGELAAMAAAILLIAGVLLPWLGYARQKSWQQRCQMQLGSIFQGLNNYVSEHDGKAPMVATAAGTPWWKVGYQGKENYSNTRNIWLLVKGKYVEPADFVCPGKRQCQAFDCSNMQNYNDFPDRRYITYSVRIRCPDAPCTLGTEPIMADSNPIFDGLEAGNSDEFKLQLTERLFTINSGNHNRRGQNVLFGDGSVEFIKDRRIGNDDIFTLQHMQLGSEVNGCELPSCQSDAFLAP